MSSQPPSDAELASRCRAGDHDAWCELVERFSPYVYAIALRAFRLSVTDAEDVFQDVFERVYGRLEQLHRDDALRPWIAQLTRRVCLDRLRDGARLAPTGEEPVERDAADELDRLTEAFAVREELAHLPEHCQEILDRFFARDESYRAIGDALGLPAGTIASRISRCLAKLKDRLEGRIVTAGGSRDREMR